MKDLQIMATTPPKKTATTKKVVAAAKPTARKAAPKATAKTNGSSDTLRDQAQALGKQAKTKAYDAATSGKARASNAMGEFANVVESVAKTIDESVGKQYGDYARKAADAVSGAASSLQSKDVDELLGDARDFVRKRPAVAIGAAAALGFALTRLLKSSDDDEA
jgi:ElaB/YqjD/DUF883 family membrane-anchored ribosome-binding protein